MPIIDPTRQFIPNSANSTTNATSSVSTTAAGTRNTSELDSSGNVSDAQKAKDDAAAREAARKKQIAQNMALSELLKNDSNYDPNVLSTLPQSNYHFRLFMTVEKDIMADMTSTTDTQEVYQLIDKTPKITIAETGVTAGLNIESVTINQITAPGWRSRSSYSTSYEIIIQEPLGMSLLESLIISAQDLDVQNYMKFWYFLELTFNGYNEDGSINTNPCEDMGLENGGRWIYMVNITNIKSSFDQSGGRHTLTCMPFEMEGLNDETCGRTPQKLTIGGKTIQEFLDDFSNQLTRAWDEMYAGEIYKFNIKARKIITNDKEYDPNGFVLAPDISDPEFSPIRNIPFSQGTTNQYVAAEIPRGASMEDVITSLFAHCESMQMLMLDTSAPMNLDDESSDGAVTWKGKKYRMAVVPVIEPEIKITGYDPITGNYMKEVTYHIWGFRTLSANMSPSQYENAGTEEVTTSMVQELLNNNYLKKRYEYRFTGLNTEVTNLDTEFNFAFSSILPQLAGWRTSIESSIDHEKHNPETAKALGTYSTQTTNVEMSASDIRKKLTAYNAQLDQLNNDLESTTDEAKKKDLTSQIATVTAQKDDLRFNAQKQRNDANLKHQMQMDTNNLPEEQYAEDFYVGMAMPYIASYNQRPGEEYAAGSGYAEQWHRGASLVGALLNQMYAPMVQAMINISLDIKGDPYWLGYSSIERRVLLNSETLRSQKLPNFAEGDSTFAFNFRIPLKVGDDGNLVIREDDVFLGVYRVTNVVHSFDKGVFKQTLTAIKLELIAPVLSKDASSDQGTSNAS